MKKLLILLCACGLPWPVDAQQGNRAGHDSMEAVVPELLIPPSPVLSVSEALASFEIADGFVIEPVAAEPLIDKPVAMAFDEDGRMWVVEMRDFMPDLDGKGEDARSGRLVVLEDTDDDGKADQRTVFAEGLHLPRAVAIVDGGVLIAEHVTLSFCRRDGAKRVGDLVVVEEAYAPAGNVEHRANGMMRHLNNWFYNAKSGTRYRWKDGELERDQTEFRGQWGITMDDFGRLYHTNNSVVLKGDRILPDVVEVFPDAKLKPKTSVNLGSSRVFPIRVNPGVNRAYIAEKNGYPSNVLDPETFRLQSATAVAGAGIYRGGSFPPKWHGVAFSCESVANLVKAVEVETDGLSLKGKPVFQDREFLASTDERFRPVNIHTAPDGSLYLVDMYHGPIQHKTYMTSYLRRQYESRGLETPSAGHGRIYRIRPEGMARGPQPRLSQATVEQLIDALSHENGWWRDTAQRLLVERSDRRIRPLLTSLLQTERRPVSRWHALWALEGRGELEVRVIEPLLASGTARELQMHALTAAQSLPEADRERLADRVADLVAEGSPVQPYAVRFLASVPKGADAFLKTALQRSGETPFVVEAATTGLLSRGIDQFPATGTELDTYLANRAQGAVVEAAEDRLAGAELASFQRGKALYQGRAACIGCHGADGAGVENLGPPLDESEWVTEDPGRLAKIMLHGMQGPLMVNGKRYEPLAVMPGMEVNPSMSDADIADVMTYIRNEWTNAVDPVDESLVAEVREATKERGGRVYTAAELLGSAAGP